MKIGDLARAAQCSVETVRYYERERLLPKPDRTANNYRLFGERHLERLRFIRNCRSLDMSHEEVRSLLRLMDRPAAECRGVGDLLGEHLAHVEARIRELRGLKAQLSELRDRCTTEAKHRVGECGIVKGIASMRLRKRAKASSHLG